MVYQWLGSRSPSGLGLMCGQLEMGTPSGRLLPSVSDKASRNEGVGIAKAIKAWRNAGEVWEAAETRLVLARLKWVCAGQRRHGGSKEFTNCLPLGDVCICAHCKGSSWGESQVRCRMLSARFCHTSSPTSKLPPLALKSPNKTNISPPGTLLTPATHHH